MTALSKYLVAIGVILPAVIIISAVNMSEIVVGIAAIAQAPATETPRWNIAYVKAEPDTPHIAQGSLSPIYPAAPGKELLGNPIYSSKLGKKLQLPVRVKRIDVRQALQLHHRPRQIYAADEQDGNYPQQSLGYADTRSSQPLRIIFGHGIY